MKMPLKMLASGLVSCLLAAPCAAAWELQWYGQSAFRIVTPGNKIIMIDPFISGNPKTPPAL